MRNYFLHILSVLAILNWSPLTAQSRLIGDWSVDCPLQVVGDSMLVCDLCEKETFDYGGGQNTAVYGFELKIEKDSMFLKNSSGTHPIKYNWNKRSKLLTFNFKGRVYKFEMIPGEKDNEFVLKERDGSVLSFEKPKADP